MSALGKKLLLKPGMRVALVGEPADQRQLYDGIETSSATPAAVVLYAATAKDLGAALPLARRRLGVGGRPRSGGCRPGREPRPARLRREARNSPSDPRRARRQALLRHRDLARPPPPQPLRPGRAHERALPGIGRRLLVRRRHGS